MGQTAPHWRNLCYLDLWTNPDSKDWARRLMEEKGVTFSDELRWGTEKIVVHNYPNKEDLMYEASLSCSPTQTYVPKISEEN